ncbi:MAG: hypothetical protein ACOYJS_04475 [Acutalibacteraceae bacterium]
MRSFKKILKFIEEKRTSIIRRIGTEEHKQNSVIFGRFCMCVLSLMLIVMGSLSYGWFIQSREVFTEPMQVEVKAPDDVVVTTTVHACVGIDENGVKYFSKEEATSYDLKKYMLLKENDRQLLLHIQFEEPEAIGNISLTAYTDTDYFLGDGEHPLLTTTDGRGEEYDNVISSIIAFYVVSPEDAVYNSDEAYKVGTTGTAYSFINKNDYSITNLLTLLENHPPQDIYVMLDYDSDLVLKLFSENFANVSFTRPDGSFFDEVFYVWDIELRVTED